MGVSIDKATDFVDVIFEFGNVVLNSFSGRVSRMEVINEFAC